MSEEKPHTEIESSGWKPIPSVEGSGPLFAEIVRRCKAANIEYEPLNIDETARRIIIVRLPAGRSKKDLTVRGTRFAEMLLGIPFEKIHGLIGYRAYCSYETGFVEARIDTGSTGTPVGFTHRRLQRLLHNRKQGDEDIDEDVRFELKHEDEQFQGISLTMFCPDGNETKWQGN